MFSLMFPCTCWWRYRIACTRKKERIKERRNKKKNGQTERQEGKKKEGTRF